MTHESTGQGRTLAGGRVLVTGGTGSFGGAFVRHVLTHLRPERIVVYSRDELKQWELRQSLDNDPRVRWLIGDVRDLDRLRQAMRGVDHVVHAAALKQVDNAERNGFEYVRTNVVGSQNVIEAALDCGVRRVVALSTDKASSPVNLYGASKLCADRLFLSANLLAEDRPTRFSIARYGNVIGSRGSVIQLFRRIAAQGRPLPVTDKRMTRFWLTLERAVRFTVDSFDLMRGGEMFVPRIPSMRLVDLAEAVAPGSPVHEIGVRPGEKLHEEMISRTESRRTVRLDDRYLVFSELQDPPPAPESADPVPDGFCYRSDRNDQWLSVEDLRAMVPP